MHVGEWAICVVSHHTAPPLRCVGRVVAVQGGDVQMRVRFSNGRSEWYLTPARWWRKVGSR